MGSFVRMFLCARLGTAGLRAVDVDRIRLDAVPLPRRHPAPWRSSWSGEVVKRSSNILWGVPSSFLSWGRVALISLAPPLTTTRPCDGAVVGTEQELHHPVAGIMPAVHGHGLAGLIKPIDIGLLFPRGK